VIKVLLSFQVRGQLGKNLLIMLILRSIVFLKRDRLIYLDKQQIIRFDKKRED